MMKQLIGTMLAGLLVFGSSVTTLAAEDGAATQATKGPRQGIELKQQQEQIVAEREELKEKAGTIRDLIQKLRKDEERNRNALEKARVDLQELKLIQEDLQQVNEQRRALRPALKEAIEHRDGEEAARIAREALRLGEVKIDLLKAANIKASQAIAHLTAAAQGQ